MSFGPMSTSKLDYTLPSSPSDGISDITFSPAGNLITAGSWDNGVRTVDHHNSLDYALLVG